MLSGGYRDCAVEKEYRFLQKLVQSSLESGPHWEEPGVSLVCLCVLFVFSPSLVCVLSVSYLSHVRLLSVSCSTLVCLFVCQLVYARAYRASLPEIMPFSFEGCDFH